MSRRAVALAGTALATLAAAAPAHAARTQVTPYLEVQQVIDVDLAGEDRRGTNVGSPGTELEFAL